MYVISTMFGVSAGSEGCRLLRPSRKEDQTAGSQVVQRQHCHGVPDNKVLHDPKGRSSRLPNRPFPRSMRSQGKRPGCGSRQACRPRSRFLRMTLR